MKLLNLYKNHFSLRGIMVIFLLMESNQHDVTLEQLKSLVRRKSVAALIAFAKKDDLQILEVPSDDKVMGHWMSIISVSGEQLHLTFKVQFSVNSARNYASQSFENPSDTISSSHSKDFIREYCNMVAGYIKNTLIHNSVSVGVSLPLLCRGFDDLFFDPPVRSRSGIDRWKLAHDGNAINCASVIEVAEHLSFTDFDYEASPAGDVEFL